MPLERENFGPLTFLLETIMIFIAFQMAHSCLNFKIDIVSA